MNKNLLIIIIVVIAGVLAGVGIWLWQYQKTAPYVPEAAPPGPVSAPPPTTLPGDNTAVINKDLDDLNIEDLNKNFEGVDSDLNAL